MIVLHIYSTGSNSIFEFKYMFFFIFYIFHIVRHILFRCKHLHVSTRIVVSMLGHRRGSD